MRNYVTIDPVRGWPHYSGLYYECLRCGGVLDGAIGKSGACACWNIVFDADAGRTVVEDESQVRLFESD